MFVCICNQVTDSEIENAVDNGACTMRELSCKLNVATCCGKCGKFAKNLLDERLKVNACKEAA